MIDKIEKGDNIVDEAVDILESRGYEAFKVEGSRGGLDIIAIPFICLKKETLLIQVTSNAWPKPAVRQRLEELDRRTPVTNEVQCWRRNDGDKNFIVHSPWDLTDNK